MSESRIYLSTSLIVLLLVLSNPVNAFLPSDVVYSQIESVTYEKSEYRDNVTHFKFIIKGQIINTSEDNVTIITPITDLYIARVTNLDQGTRGDSPSSMLPKKQIIFYILVYITTQ